MDSPKSDELLAEFDRRSPALINPKDPNSAKDIELFRRLFNQFLSEPYKVDWSQIRPMAADQQLLYENLPSVANEQERMALLGRIAIVKLNGGLGTTMGCKGPKSLVELRDGMTFLDFTIRQHQILNENLGGTEIPLLLMNSFNTDTQTTKYLASKPSPIPVKCFCQSRCPRICSNTLIPVPNRWDDCPEEGWFPPGHGNVFLAMAHNGIIDELLAQGRDLAFFANIDNTGAIFDERIAKILADGKADYLMEMTPRTEADVKGGTLVEVNNGERLMHLECPQVPDDRVEEFCSLRTFKIFNTNNIWVNLAAVRRQLDQLKMEILANEKRLSSGCRVIQLEQSIGGAIRNFPGRAMAVCVPRTRFLPVKSTADLFRLRSSCLFQFDSSQCLLRQCSPTLPKVLLSEEFSALADFERRIPKIPTLLGVQRISLGGDVWIGKGVQMRGIVDVHAQAGKPIHVPQNSIIGKEED